jgi:hypothetical protein
MLDPGPPPESAAGPGADRDLGRARLDAMLSVSGRVVAGESLEDTLAHISRAAAEVAGARAAAVLLVGPGRVLHFGGSWGLSEEYREVIKARLMRGVGPTGTAVSERRAMVVSDISTHPGLQMWRAAAMREGWRALASTPLRIDGETVGVLNVYRSEAGPWEDVELEVLAFFCDHAVTAIRIANLMQHQDGQLQALERIVRGLREQTHEHANRLHSVSGLLALGETEEARRFVAELLANHGQSYHAVASGIEHPTLAGLLLAEATVAGQRGITLRIDRRSRVTTLPAQLGDAQLIAIVGHLLEQSFEALADVGPRRRRATFAAFSSATEVVFRVRDWGAARLPTLSSSLLADAVSAVDGRLDVTSEAVGVTTAVTVPVRPALRGAVPPH